MSRLVPALLWFAALTGCGAADPCASVPCTAPRVCMMKGSAVSPKVTCEVPDAGP
ncbi:MAG: hypothetical protein QM817_06990 [Archangium sp.]